MVLRARNDAEAARNAARTPLPNGRTIRVFLLDDHELMRRGLRDLLTEDPRIQIVGEAAGEADALVLIPATRPDVALLDVRLPDGSGIEVCRQVRSCRPEIAVLILTAYEDGDRTAAAASLAGASGVLLKRIRGRELIDAVHRVAAGEPLVTAPGRITEIIRPDDPSEPDLLATLTAQERRVLDLIVDGMTNRQIGDRLGIGENTVKNYVTSILVKLGFARRTQAAVFGARMRRQ